MWQVTRDRWHMTCDMWHVLGGKNSLKIVAPLLLQCVIYDIMKIWRKRMTHLMNESINYEAVCRTTPATPGLFKIIAGIIQM